MIGRSIEEDKFRIAEACYKRCREKWVTCAGCHLDFYCPKGRGEKMQEEKVQEWSMDVVMALINSGDRWMDLAHKYFALGDDQAAQICRTKADARYDRADEMLDWMAESKPD